MDKVSFSILDVNKANELSLQGNQVFFGMDVGCGQGNTYESRKDLRQAKKYN